MLRHFWQRNLPSQQKDESKGKEWSFSRELQAHTSCNPGQVQVLCCGMWIISPVSQGGESLGSCRESDLLRKGAGSGRFWLSLPNVSTCRCNSGALLWIKRILTWKCLMERLTSWHISNCHLQSLKQLLVFALKPYSVMHNSNPLRYITYY